MFHYLEKLEHILLTLLVLLTAENLRSRPEGHLVEMLGKSAQIRYELFLLLLGPDHDFGNLCAFGEDKTKH